MPALRRQFANPPREFGMMPFWFWNDDLQEDEIRRQIREFHAKGCGGFIPHARIGLSRRIGYLTPEYFRLLQIAVAEAARLDLKVVLYDEGSYPSGSAQGRVVAENPDYAARCLIALQQTVTGPASGYWRPNPGRNLSDRLLAVLAARETREQRLDAASLTVLPITDTELARYSLPAGTWRLIAIWDVASGGRIRGVFAEEEDGHALAPAAGDILSPAAVACFIRHTHEQFYAHLAPYFGNTIVAMFTDEPGPLGRGPQRGPQPQPFTEGFLDDLQAEWDGEVRLWLPALWCDCGVRTAAFRDAYQRALHARLNRVFYGAQACWCEAHGIALTGHPERSDESGALRRFDWPGQDMVWRYVEPARPSALEGPHSTAAKAAHSAAVLANRRFSAAEVFGAYGWQLTLDEVKWLFDWHLVRGNNLFFPHAMFYSIRGRRAFESEPDLGLHNVWWPYWGQIGDYVRRLCWLFTDGEELADAALLADPDRLPWQAAKALYQAQVSFIYADAAAILADPAGAAGVRLGRGALTVRSLLADPPALLTPILQQQLAACQGNGSTVLADWTPETLPAALAGLPGRLVHWSGSPDLRVRPYRRAGRDWFLLVNEGEQDLDGGLQLAGSGALELWDPMNGQTCPWPSHAAGDRLHTQVHLERRQALVLAIVPTGNEAIASDDATPLPGPVIQELYGPWTVTHRDGSRLTVPVPGDWARLRELELFSGTLCYETSFAVVPATAATARFLDLGQVGNIAEVTLNGQPLGVRAWAPYRWQLPPRALRDGLNTLAIRVTNSMANACDGRQMPSGLLSPVGLRGTVLDKLSS